MSTWHVVGHRGDEVQVILKVDDTTKRVTKFSNPAGTSPYYGFGRMMQRRGMVLFADVVKMWASNANFVR